MRINTGCWMNGCKCFDPDDEDGIEVKKEWIGLTDDEIESLDCVYLDDLGDGSEVSQLSLSMFARTLEAKLKEKNT